MEITWYGHNCFRLTERGNATVVTDPYDHTEAGYKQLNLKADIVAVSSNTPDCNNVKAVKGTSWEITGPGEYEIGDVFLTAIASGKKKAENGFNLIFVFDYSGIKIAHLGKLNAIPKRNELDALGTIDVLLVPVGSGGALTAAKAAETISLIEPGIVIPMHFQTDDSQADLKPLDQFLKEMGLGKSLEAEESLKITKSKVPENTQVILLNHKS